MRAIALSVISAAAFALGSCAGSLPPPNAKPGMLTAGVAPSTANPRKAEFNPFREEGVSPAFGRRQVIANPTVAQVMQEGPLPEMAIGRPDAPVTIIKYASLTCPYCRKFQLETFPVLKREYIDTGKVRFILREFPIGFQSGAATIALRCAPAPAYFALYGDFLKNQRSWVSQEVRHDPIFRIARKHGVSRAKFDACVKDKKLIADLKWVKDRGRTLGVIGTPNFFVNGKLVKRVLTMKDFHRIVANVVDGRVASSNKQ